MVFHRHSCLPASMMELVAMPHHTDTMAMFYNKRMFEEAGIRIPTSVEDGYTWEELILQEP